MKKVLFFFIFLICSYFIFAYNVQNNTKLYFISKQYIPNDLKRFIRSTFTKINTLYIYNTSSFSFKEKKSIKIESLKNDKNMKVYTNSNLIWTGPRAYFASDLNNLFLITGTGILMHIDKTSFDTNSKKIQFKVINTNLENILENYKENKFYSYTSMVKSILYKNNNLYISLVQKLDKNCYTHIIYKGAVDLTKIKFNEFYKFDRCKPFYTDYLGGSLADFKKDKILITIGDWTICEDFRWVDRNPKGFCTENGAQSLDTEFGKIFELDLNTKEIKIISIGHDNPQGIFYSAEYDTIISTEHGPQGGDEINININPSNKNIKNFGYPISSYGEHYGYPSPDVEYLYTEAPLHKSHDKYGFTEPVDYFVPSIGISDVVKFNNKLLVASMGSDIDQGDLSLHVYTIDNNLNLSKEKINKVYQRIRDIHIFNGNVFMFLESTGSLGVFSINNL